MESLGVGAVAACRLRQVQAAGDEDGESEEREDRRQQGDGLHDIDALPSVEHSRKLGLKHGHSLRVGPLAGIPIGRLSYPPMARFLLACRVLPP